MENYYIKFEKQINEIKNGDKKPRLLLQACCCPCSSYCLELLAGVFDITVYFYNPNIDDEEEYTKRLNELFRFTKTAADPTKNSSANTPRAAGIEDFTAVPSSFAIR